MISAPERESVISARTEDGTDSIGAQVSALIWRPRVLMQAAADRNILTDGLLPPSPRPPPTGLHSFEGAKLKTAEDLQLARPNTVLKTHGI
jgi:hypothetical protein